MINLLSNEQKRTVKRVYLSRLAVVGLFLFAGAWIAGTLLLVPSYLLLRVQAGSFAEEERLLAEQAGVEGELSPQELLKQTEDRRILLDAYDARISIAPLIVLITEARGPGVYVDSFLFKNDEVPVVLIRGRASERDALVSFSRRLEEIPAIASVELPVSNLASSVDIEFSMRIVIEESIQQP